MNAGKDVDPDIVSWCRDCAPDMDAEIMHIYPKSTDNIKKVRYFAVKDYERALYYPQGEFVGELGGGIYEIEKEAQIKGTEIIWFDTSINEISWGFPATNGIPTMDGLMVGLFGDIKLRVSNVRTFYQDVVGGGNEWNLQDLKDWIKNLLQTSLRDIFKKYEINQILREDRERVIYQVTAKVTEEFSQYGLDLVSFNVLGIKTPDGANFASLQAIGTDRNTQNPVPFPEMLNKKFNEFRGKMRDQFQIIGDRLKSIFLITTASNNELFNKAINRANEHVARAKEAFAAGNYPKSRGAWEKAEQEFQKALKVAPSEVEKNKLQQNIVSTKINECNTFLENANQVGKQGQTLQQNTELAKATEKFENAIQLNLQALEFITKNSKISFPVKRTLVLQKNKTYALKLQQLAIEEKCIGAERKLEVAIRTQNDPNFTTEGIAAISEALKILNEAKMDAQKIPELAELEDKIHQKMIGARQTQQKLQEKLDSLLSLVPTTPITPLDDGETIGTEKQNTTKPGTSPKRAGKTEKSFKISREYEFVGGQVRFKFSLLNKTGEVLTDIAIMFRIPDALKWVTHEPNYERKGDTLIIPKLGLGEKKAVSLYLEPLNCLKSPLNASITFFDGKNRPQAVAMDPKEIEVTCPIFFTREDANLARVRNLRDNAAHKDLKLLPILDTKKLEEFFTTALDVIGKYDVKLISQEFSLDKKTGEAWFYGITKVEKQKIVIAVRLAGDKQVLEVEVSGDDQEKNTAFLAEIEGQMRRSLETEQALPTDLQFYDIRTSILLGTCPYCGANIPMESIQDFKDGNSIQCIFCDTKIFPN